MSLPTRSCARAFSFRLFVCATHQRPVKSQIAFSCGQMTGGFSFAFSNFHLLVQCTALGTQPYSGRPQTQLNPNAVLADIT